MVRPVVIAVSQNDQSTLLNILNHLDAMGMAVIVVDDGSTDSTAQVLGNWSKSAGDHRLVTFVQSQGKAMAMRAAFTAATRGGFTHAVFIASSGEHSPGEIPRLLEKSREHQAALVSGIRDLKGGNYPLGTGFKRWLSNLFVRFETGHIVSDSQCDLRVYPLASAGAIRCKCGGSQFASEMMVRSLWAEIPVLELPVRCRYVAAQNSTPLEFLAAVGMHLRLLATAMNPVHRIHIEPGSRPRQSVPRQFLHWLNPITAWRQIRHTEGARTRFAVGFAIGVYLGNTPAYGVQTLIGFYVAKRFHLHPVSVVAGVNISVPIGPLLIALAIAVGHWMLHGQWPTLQTYHFGPGGWHGLLLPMLIEWIVGSVVVGGVLGALSFFALDGLLRLIPDPKPAVEPVA